MSKLLEQAKSGPARTEAVKEALGRPRRVSFSRRHTPLEKFRPGQPLKIEIAVEKPVSVRLYYRHVNQAERWESVEMQAAGGRHSAILAGSYTDWNSPLQYYFELKQGPDAACLYPGFVTGLTNQPYFVVHRA